MKRSMFGITVLLGILIYSCHPVAKYISSESVLRWEPDIQQFDSLNSIEGADPGTLVITGSSSVRLWDSIHSDLAPFEVIQRGYGGAKLSDFNFYAKRIIPRGQLKGIVVFVANDISGGDYDRDPREVLKLFQVLVNQIREHNPGTPVYWIETTPTPSRWHVIEKARKANRLISGYCSRNEDLHFIATYDSFLTPGLLPDSAYFRNDMLHLNRNGYKHWTEIIKSKLEKSGLTP